MMSSKLFLLASFLVVSVHANHAALKEMDEVFRRSAAVRNRSIEAMTKSMTVSKAWRVLEKNNLQTKALLSVKNALNGKQSSLRKAGYNGVESARIMLNELIYDAAKNYDDEIADCTSLYSKFCTGMQDALHSIAASNFEGADSERQIADSERRIAMAEPDISKGRSKFKEHDRMCKAELLKMDAHLTTLDGDLKVLSNILDLTSCGQKNSTSLLQCKDSCSKEMFIAFDSNDAQKKLEELQSPVSRELVQEALKHEAEQSSKSFSFVQLHSHGPESSEVSMAPRVERPSAPCSDKNAGAPASQKLANKCTLTPGSCTVLRGRFLKITSGIIDEKTNLMDTISDFTKYCADEKRAIEDEINNDETILESARVSLAEGTGKKAQAMDDATNTAKDYALKKSMLEKEMNRCNDNYIELQSEMCALRKIRGELSKMKSSGHSASFQDCEVGPWEQNPCSKACGGGEQDLVREVMSAANGGAKCLPLTEKRTCNLQECPVDCVLEEWGGWSKCSAECGTGVQTRLRQVQQAPKYEGRPCDVTIDERSCNVQDCAKDCQLGSWTQWDGCSKDCGSGTNKRVKYVISPAEGQGKCAGQWSPKRLQYKMCHTHECPRNLTCDRELDVVLVLDASTSLDQVGWDAQLKAADVFANAFNVPGGQARMSVILYSGPSYYYGKFGVKSCLRGAKDVEGTANMDNYCKLRTVVSMEDDKSSNIAAVRSEIAALPWRKGSTLTSLALYRAKAEIDLSPRKDAPSVVVVFTDGKPFSAFRTWRASKTVRKTARLLWVLITKSAPLKLFRWFASRRWQENLIVVKDFEELGEEPYRVVDSIMADICPSQLQ